MFTGLVQETGRVEGLRKLKAGDGAVTRISIAAKSVPRELKGGDSVAVSGVCLTAIEVGRRKFSADLAEETLRRTSLGSLRKGSVVNLELPARPMDRLGGHIVQGHVDGTGKLAGLKQVAGGKDWRLVIELPEALEKYVVAQGSVCIEGISLTVAKIEGRRLEAAIIPHTYEVTSLRGLRLGDLVNIEVDVLAKYVEKIAKKENKTSLTMAELARRGF